MSKTEVLTPDVIEEVPLEKQIENSLVKHNVTDKVINALKKQYSGMKLKALDDKQSFLEIKEARNAVRKIGILAEKCCKVGREDAVKIQKLWLAKEKEVLAKIDEVQAPLDAEIKKYEDERDRLEQLEIQRKEEQFMKRQTTLLKMEAIYSGNSFTLGNVSYELENIKEADEEIWTDTILPKYQKEFAKVEEEKAKLEQQKKETEEKLRLEQEELLHQQNELKKAQEEIKKQQEELQKQKDEAEKVKKEEQDKAEREAKQKQDAIINNRIQQLINLGLNYSPQYSAYIGYNCNIDVMTELKLWNEQEWKDAIEKITPVIEAAKQQEEEKRIADIQKKERERIEEEQRQAQLKIQQEEQKKLEELAKASDKEKWQVLLTSLASIQFPEFKSGIYKGKLSIVKEKFEEIKEL